MISDGSLSPSFHNPNNSAADHDASRGIMFDEFSAQKIKKKIKKIKKNKEKTFPGIHFPHAATCKSKVTHSSVTFNSLDHQNSCS